MKNNQVFIGTLNKALPALSPALFPLRTEVNFPKILEENVGNFCPICWKTIFSNLLEIDGKVYLEKNCCTKELVFMENDVEFFKKHKKNMEVEPFVSNPRSFQEWISGNPNYGTSSIAACITTKCNQNCPICIVKFENKCFNPNREYNASIEEIKKGIKKYNSRQIFLLGGEPTTREDLFEIIKAIKDSGNLPAIYTNGQKLKDKNYVKKLKKAGLDRIVLQFDGFNKTANIKLRGQDFLEIKLKALENIKEAGGLKLQLAPVIEKGLNEAEMSKIIQFGLENEFINNITFLGLTPPPYKSTTATTHSDLIKIMEKEGYFDQNYFLELVKMYQNIYILTRKIFDGTPLKNWIFKRLSGSFNNVHFIKGTNPPQLLFQEEEIIKINKILAKALNKKSKIASLGILLKNSKELIKSPLTMLFREKFFIVNNKTLLSNKLLEVGFHKIVGADNKLLKQIRASAALLFASIPSHLAVDNQF